MQNIPLNFFPETWSQKTSFLTMRWVFLFFISNVPTLIAVCIYQDTLFVLVRITTGFKHLLRIYYIRPLHTWNRFSGHSSRNLYHLWTRVLFPLSAVQNACDWIRSYWWFPCLAVFRNGGSCGWDRLSCAAANIPGQQWNPQSPGIMSRLCGTCFLKMSLSPLLKGTYHLDGLWIVQRRHFPDWHHLYILWNTWGTTALNYIFAT